MSWLGYQAVVKKKLKTKKIMIVGLNLIVLNKDLNPGLSTCRKELEHLDLGLDLFYFI